MLGAPEAAATDGTVAVEAGAVGATRAVTAGAPERGAEGTASCAASCCGSAVKLLANATPAATPADRATQNGLTRRRGALGALGAGGRCATREWAASESA